jgi:hypothetical protein
MRAIPTAAALICATLVPACAPIAWDRPGTTPEQFSMDNARCQLMAQGTTPDVNVGDISTGNFKRDLAVNAAAGILGALAQGAAVQQKYQMCMQANGYVPRSPATPPVLTAAPAPAPVPLPTSIAVAVPAPAPVPIVPTAVAALPPPPPGCPPALNPRWAVPDDSRGLMLLCIQGEKYPAFLSRGPGYSSFYY